ncbi:alkaline phosphatase family protein [Fulvivirgaceae bacterium BMA10]|uniref:Alkaline phosphatase family protein n=1 Tax=Splendidivirga corallicola TaxID=3051826 RepID=A0ABT8KL91_9BACT|nr:alkaline phosphatase family protein [Fulvivirgaceae bacterium BMA10]
MQKTVVLNVVGLTSSLIGPHTPFLKKWSASQSQTPIKPVLPAVTCSAQSTYLTGKYPDTHGIVGNGWYFKDECEVKFWRQSNKLVEAQKVWDIAKQKDPTFTSANMFWWYNMYSTADFSVTPRPNYLADGRKIPDIYSNPAELRDKLQTELGVFPLFNFWGPNTSIKSSQWIADASKITDDLHDPTLTLIYLPHMDYNLQRHGTKHPSIAKDLREIDAVCGELITFYEKKGARVLVLSEYGITDVSCPIALNRVLREKGLIAIREERGLELLDAGASKAFAVADHQIAHIYVNDQEKINEVREIVEQVAGVEKVLGKDEKSTNHLDHDRSGDLVAIADKDSWFNYYFWLDDKKAPDFARMVDIHKKPGYDPVEMFINPKIKFPIPLIASKLIKKKLGFRTMMDVIPLDASLIKGSHGRIPESKSDWPLLISNNLDLSANNSIEPTKVFDIILENVFNS